VTTLPTRDVRPATPRARILRLDLNGAAFPYQAGQAVLIGTHGGTVRRPYSIAASPEESRREDCLELLIGVDATGTPGPHLTLAPDARIDVEGPVGTFTFPTNPVEARFVFIAGGTGIAPLRAMLHRALTIPHREIGVFYSARTPEEFAYQDELRTLAADGRIELHQTVTRTADDAWQGARGRIDRVGLERLIHDPETLCFVCGPPSLVTEMPRLLGDLGVERRRIRMEEW
jgi:Na+-transporting NADH:ubiquinone oxidoreductase subunit F